jgi:hypothetical protein
MRNKLLTTLAALSFLGPVALSYACGGGGGDTAPTNNPTSSATATTPPTDSNTATATASSAAVDPPKPVAPQYALGITSAKFTPDKTAKLKAIEVKDDGSVNLGGRPAYQLVNNELRDTTGTALLRVGKDGVVTQGDGKAFGNFDGSDAMQINGGASITLGDDGVLKVLDAPTKPSKTMKGKFDHVDAKGRRALITVVAIEWMLAASAPH